MHKIDFKKASVMGFWVLISSIFQAVALTSFSVPGRLYPSGISGISRLTSDLLLDFLSINIPYQVFYFGVNILLAILVYKYIGKYFTVFSVIQTTLVSIFSSFFSRIIFLDDLILIAVFGGLINGFGCGLALKSNASTGGMDFISIYFSNKYNKSMWNTIFAINSVVIVITGIVYGWPRALYSIMFQFCSTQVVNRMHKRFTHQSLNIITKYPDAVTDNIFKKTRHGITEMKAMGAFKKEDTTMLYMVINSYQVDDVIKSIQEADPKAFISVSNVRQVVGNYYQKPLD